MPIKAVLFDFMGTCLDWHSSIVASLPTGIPKETRSDFALDWRHAYFAANGARAAAGQAPEDIDITHARTLEEVLGRASYAGFAPLFTTEVRRACVAAWHAQPAWPEVGGALERLRARGLEVLVHANGTTRLQLDLCRSSALRFDMLLSSELLGHIKPVPENYTRALDLLKLSPDDCVTVAAHAYDLRGARAVGMKTVYVYRWTDDVNEDQEVVKGDNDAYLTDMNDLDKVISQL